MNFKLIRAFIIILIVASEEVKGNHDSQVIERQFSTANKKIPSQNSQPLRITFDVSHLNENGISEQQMKQLNSILNTVAIFMKKFIKVVPVQGNNLLDNEKEECSQYVDLSENDKRIGIENSDLHLYIKQITSQDESYSCSFLKNKNIVRPNFGILQLDINTIPTTELKPIVFQQIVSEVIHNIIHILSFDGNKITQWIDKETNSQYGIENIHKIILTETIENKTRKILKSPQVLATARKFYGCNHYPGVQLEQPDNPNNIGSHWDRSILPSEIMSPRSSYIIVQISVFIVALLQDTGYFAGVNENLTDNIYWGKDIGCEHETNQQNVNKRYDCSFQNEGKFLEVNGKLESQFCQDSSNIRYNSFDDFGYNSRCFVSNLKDKKPLSSRIFSEARCHQHECSQNQQQIFIFFTEYPDLRLTCDKNNIGASIPVEYRGEIIGTINCPDNYQKFCDYKICKNFCSSHGICLSGNCHCNPGYSGEDCSQDGAPGCPVKYYTNPDYTCKETCPRGYYQNTDENKCQLCDFSCSSCTGPLSTDCTACQFLTYLDGSVCVNLCPVGKYTEESMNSCVECPEGCLNCTSATDCGDCQSGYEKQGSTCVEIKCDSSCRTCDLKLSKDNCTSCDDGKFLISSLSSCGTENSCPVGTYADTSKNICQNCTPLCKSCSSEIVCTDCHDGHFLINNQCVICEPDCSECLSEKPSTCTRCKNGKFLHNEGCHDVCPQGTYKNVENYTCSSCPIGCTSCKSPKVCDVCNKEDGYFEDKGTCIRCQGDCLICDRQNTSICKSCQTRKFFHNNHCYDICPKGTFADHKSKLCLNCMKGCLKCKQFEVCFKCDLLQGYVLDQAVCKPRCQKNCLTCDIKRSKWCTSCKKGLYLHQKQCLQKCPINTSEDDSNYTCSPCRIGFVYAENQCIQCSPGCSKCLPQDPLKCTSCLEGFSFNSSMLMCEKIWTYFDGIYKKLYSGYRT